MGYDSVSQQPNSNNSSHLFLVVLPLRGCHLTLLTYTPLPSGILVAHTVTLFVLHSHSPFALHITHSLHCHVAHFVTALCNTHSHTVLHPMSAVSWDPNPTQRFLLKHFSGPVANFLAIVACPPHSHHPNFGFSPSRWAAPVPIQPFPQGPPWSGSLQSGKFLHQGPWFSLPPGGIGIFPFPFWPGFLPAVSPWPAQLFSASPSSPTPVLRALAVLAHGWPFSRSLGGAVFSHGPTQTLALPHFPSFPFHHFPPTPATGFPSAPGFLAPRIFPALPRSSFCTLLPLPSLCPHPFPGAQNPFCQPFPGWAFLLLAPPPPHVGCGGPPSRGAHFWGVCGPTTRGVSLCSTPASLSLAHPPNATTWGLPILSPTCRRRPTGFLSAILLPPPPAAPDFHPPTRLKFPHGGAPSEDTGPHPQIAHLTLIRGTTTHAH